MLEDLSKRYVYKKHARDLVHYFERYVEIFFTSPDVIRSELDTNVHGYVMLCQDSENIMIGDSKIRN